MNLRWFWFYSFLIPLSLFAKDEFKSTNENIFTFKTEPSILEEDKQLKISFETDGFCDVTVVIEDDRGTIVRHFASGVLGANAPKPFQANSKKQELFWDYKDDIGEYVTNLNQLKVRVSLGLKPQFDRTLFWSPEKRINRQNATLICPTEKGVLTFEGEGIDQLKLFSSEGQYIRTVYPFAAKDIANVPLERVTAPQTGASVPRKFGSTHFSSLLKIGSNMNKALGKYGQAAQSIVAYKDKIGLLGYKMGILTLGTEMDQVVVDGPDIFVKTKAVKGDVKQAPRSAAVSPDGKWIYLAGYIDHHAVKRIAFSKEGKLENFLGKEDGSKGTKEGEFDGAAAVACDSQGRIYVSDFCNNRIQIFSPEGKFLKSIPFTKPNVMQINPHNGDIYVSSWLTMYSKSSTDGPAKPELIHLGNFDNPIEKSRVELPFIGYSKSIFMNHSNWTFYNVVIDFYQKQPVVWVLPGRVGTNSDLWIARGLQLKASEDVCMKLFVEDGKALKKIGDFGPAITTTVKRFLPPVISRQRLYVNPKTEKLYVGEGDSGVMKSFQELVEIDPSSGAVSFMKLPFTAEDLCFDYTGLIYLRTDVNVMRFDPQTWKEIPFDYGAEQTTMGFVPRKIEPPAMSVLNLPTIGKPGQFHLGGMAINRKLDIAISCFNSNIALGDDPVQEGSLDYSTKRKGGSRYAPTIYPGRTRYAEIHIWDKYGQLIKEDAFPGLGITDGIALDNDLGLYVMADGARVMDGKKFWDPTSSTIIKAEPKKAKVLSIKRAEVPLPKTEVPQRPPDIISGSLGESWVEGASWFYGGVGFAGFSEPSNGSACACWNARFVLDDLKRTFAPEITNYSVAVLDTNGNVILRIGKYGNIEDGVPVHKEGGPNETRSIGGDEVALFHAAYVATLSDKKLFIADAGNSRILSVNLGYHTQKVIPIK